jgi:hypothetical protein
MPVDLEGDEMVAVAHFHLHCDCVSLSNLPILSQRCRACLSLLSCYCSISYRYGDANIKIILFLAGFAGGILSPLLRAAFVRIGRFFDRFASFFATFALFSAKIVYTFVQLGALSAPAATSPALSL